MNWILILTIWGYSSSSGSTMTQVGPFADNQSCQAAAKVWMGKAREADGLARYWAVCAQTKAEP